MRVVLALDIVTGLFGHNTTLITIFARDILGTGPQGLGLLLSAIGAGALVGMSLMVTFDVSRYGRLILTAGALYVVLWAAFGLSLWLFLSVILLFALGFVDGVWSVTRNTLAQLLVTDELRGRVMSVVTLVTRGSSLVGRFQAGILVELIGGPAAVLAGTAVIDPSGRESRRSSHRKNVSNLIGWPRRLCMESNCQGRRGAGMLHCFEMENDQGEEGPGAAPEADPVLRPYMELEDYGSLYVSGVAVEMEFRGQGLGTKLIERAEARARELGLPRVSLI